jgi:hypothetical protein
VKQISDLQKGLKSNTSPRSVMTEAHLGEENTCISKNFIVMSIACVGNKYPYVLLGLTARDALTYEEDIPVRVNEISQRLLPQIFYIKLNLNEYARSNLSVGDTLTVDIHRSQNYLDQFIPEASSSFARPKRSDRGEP